MTPKTDWAEAVIVLGSFTLGILIVWALTRILLATFCIQ